MMPRVGFEPTAYGLEDRCSIQLSYRDNNSTDYKVILILLSITNMTSVWRWVI